MQGDHWVCDSRASFEKLIAEMRKDFDEHNYIRAQYKIGKQRSPKQNNALHKFCDLLANALNDAGLDMKHVLKPDVDIPWTGLAVKNHLWRPVQKAMLGKESTVEPHRDEYPKIYDVLNRHLIDKHSISVPWPCKENNEAAK
jgi:hypothetical protein